MPSFLHSLSSDCHRMTPKPTALAWTFLLISRSFCFIVLLSFKMCYSSSSITFLVFSDTEPFSWFLSLGVTVTHFQWWKYFRCYWFQAFAHYPISNHASTSHSWAYLTIVRYFFTCSLPVTRIYPYSPLFSRSWYWNLSPHLLPLNGGMFPKAGPLLFFQAVFRSMSLKIQCSELNTKLQDTGVGQWMDCTSNKTL